MISYNSSFVSNDYQNGKMLQFKFSSESAVCENVFVEAKLKQFSLKFIDI